MTRLTRPAARQTGARRLPAGFFMTDSVRQPDWPDILGRLPAGFGVILRDYHHPARADLAAAIAALCATRDLVLLIAGDAALARKFGAGLHMPEKMAGRLARESIAAGQLRTQAAHGAKGLVQAGRLAVDAALLSPVFPTASHPNAATLGPVRLAGLVRQAPVPVYALGGISAINVKRLKPSGISGYAGISGFDGFGFDGLSFHGA